MSQVARLYQKIPHQTRGLLLTCLCGIAGGLVAVAFHHAISLVYDGLWSPLAGVSVARFAWTSLLILVSVGLLGGILLAVWAPAAAGSGIPQMKLAYWRDRGHVPVGTVLVKFFAGTLSVGGGLSLGREGPTVQISGGLASWLASKLGVVDFQRRTAAACGAAAGLAAAFNTPIAAVTFVLEEIIEDLNSRAIGRILLASVVAVFVLYLFKGNEPAFHIPAVKKFHWMVYILALPVGACAALVGGIFQKASLGWRRNIRDHSRLPQWARPTVGALVTWLAACAVFAGTGRMGVLGLGYADLGLGLAGGLAVGTAAALLAAKFIATTACYAWGGCGGIFAPTLFLGAMTGCLLARSMALAVDIPREDVTVLAVVGMSACLGAVVRAPVTSILIVFEMTHDFAMVPPLMLGTLVSQGISRWLNRDNFYTQVLHDDGINMEQHVEARDFTSWKSRRVSTYASFLVKKVERWDPPFLEALLRESCFAAYPVLDTEGKLHGVVARTSLEPYLSGAERPPVFPAVTAAPDATLGEIEALLIDAPLNVVVLVDSTRVVVGIFTLHDLLRSQMREIGAD